AVGDDITNPEYVAGCGEEQDGDLARLSGPEVTLHVRKSEHVQAEGVHHHCAGIIRDAEISHIDQAIKITWYEQRRLANALALWPAEHLGAGDPHDFGNHATHCIPALLWRPAGAEHLGYQQAATAGRDGRLRVLPVPCLADIGQGLAIL